MAAMDAQVHGQAVEAAERAIEALGRHDPGAARMAVAEAADGDHPGWFSRISDAVYLAAWKLEQDEEIDQATWDHLADAVGTGSLRAVVERARG